MKALILLLGFLAFTAFADTKQICIAPNKDLRLTVYSDGIWYQNRVSTAQTSQFFMPIINGSVYGEESEFKAYAAKLSIEGSLFKSNIKKQKAVVSLYFEDILDFKGELLCKGYELTKISGKESTFSKNLRNLKLSDSYIEEFQRPIFYKVNKNYEFKIQAGSLVGTLLEIGDWYGFIASESQSRKISRFLAVEHTELMNKLSKYTNMTLEGYIFSRDWYSGEGRIGAIYKKSNKLMLIVLPFDYHTFGDDNMDYVY